MEIDKYKWLQNKQGYGSSNHGKQYIELVKEFDSLLDLGTGDGSFCVDVAPYMERVCGVDWVIKSNTGVPFNVQLIECDAIRLPFKNKTFDVTTSWDFMEHLLTENVEKVVKEQVRVTKHRLIHKISLRPSSSFREELQKKFGDGELHKTVQKAEWWAGVFKPYAESVTIRESENNSVLLYVKLKEYEN